MYFSLLVALSIDLSTTQISFLSPNTSKLYHYDFVVFMNGNVLFVWELSVLHQENTTSLWEYKLIY